jgi:catechol 2,3-dioxygenase-like lactoylglutathione lyase family enzyme
VFDHVMIRTSDRAASEQFYDTVLNALGIEKSYSDASFAEWRDFALTAADGQTPPTQGLHIGFVAATQADVDAFWRAGTEAGYRSDGEPGPRPEYGPDYYGSFLLDPDGNSAEAVNHDALRVGGSIDHLWIRVADVAAAKAFYETVAPHVGIRVAADEPERVQFSGAGAGAGGGGSFSVVAGTPSRHIHLAFPVGDDAAVRGFHEAAMDAGYADNGAPGERAGYHPGYYAAFALDPDGHNVEAVNHNR